MTQEGEVGTETDSRCGGSQGERRADLLEGASLKVA